MIINKKNEDVMKIFCETPGTFGDYKVTTTGNLCPVYFDPRAAFSYPTKLHEIAKVCAMEIQKLGEIDMILGGATAGISLAAYIGQVLNKRFGYVRKQPKENASNTVEGIFEKGSKAVLVDDASGQGKAKIMFVNNIRSEGYRIDNVIAVAARTMRGDGAEKANSWVAPLSVNLVCLCDAYDIVEYGNKKGLISDEVCNLITWYADDARHWKDDPEKWAYFLKYTEKTGQDISGLR